MEDPMPAENIGGSEHVHPPVLENDNPLSAVFYSVTGFFESYGWILLFGFIVGMFLKSKLAPAVNKYKKQLQDTIESKKFDADAAQSRMERMEAARRRMQEQLDAQSARHAEQMKKKEEEKRQQKIDDWEGHLQGKGYRSKHKVNEQQQETSTKLNKEKKSKPLRQSDYNPLAGGSDSCAWRPSQRRGGGG